MMFLVKIFKNLFVGKKLLCNPCFNWGHFLAAFKNKEIFIYRFNLAAFEARKIVKNATNATYSTIVTHYVE